MPYFPVEKVEELYPGAGPYMFPPMLIHKAEISQLKNASASNKYFGEIKKDGSLYYYVGTHSGSYLFGRTTSVKTKLLTEKGANVPHIMAALDCLPKDTIILGEMYYPGKTSKDVTSIMGCLPEKAKERQNGSYGYLHFYIYDCLFYNGVSCFDRTNWERYKVTEAIYNKFLSEFKYIELAEAFEDNLYERIGDALAQGEEGMVLKLKTGLYEPGKRPLSNLKAKQIDYVDAIITGFKEPTKEYTGKDVQNWTYWIDKNTNELLPISTHCADFDNAIPVTKHWYYNWKNGIEISAFDKKTGKLVNIGTISSGLTDNLREEFSQHPNDYLGRVCAIQCMSLDKERFTIRHGFFRGFRDDKNAGECTVESIFG